MRKVNLRMNEHEKYILIKNLVDNNGSKKRTALKLNLSIRQINRLIIKYKEKGKSGFVHGNRSKTPVHTYDKSFSDNIIFLYKNKYKNFNILHFKDYLFENESIVVSYNFIYTLFKKNNILSPKAQRKTKKDFKKKQLLESEKITNKTDKEIDIIVSREVDFEFSHPRCEKPKYFGEVVEQDGSIHNWFGDKKSCLHLSIDKASSTVLGGYFDYQETLFGYYNVLHQILKNYGIPYLFFTDNRTIFNYKSLNPDKRTSDKDVFTQYSYACKELGIDIKTSSVSQNKGLIERTNGTFQGRLVNELLLNNITSIDEANNYLINVFIPKFNEKFALDYKKFDSVFEVAPDDNKINYTLSVLTPRKIDNGSAIKYKNKYYQAYSNNTKKCFLPKTPCLVVNAFNGDLLVSIDDSIYELRELDRNSKSSDVFDIPSKESQKTKTKYIPPMSHPWKHRTFINHLNNCNKSDHNYADV